MVVFPANRLASRPLSFCDRSEAVAGRLFEARTTLLGLIATRSAGRPSSGSSDENSEAAIPVAAEMFYRVLRPQGTWRPGLPCAWHLDRSAFALCIATS